MPGSSLPGAQVLVATDPVLTSDMTQGCDRREAVMALGLGLDGCRGMAAGQSLHGGLGGAQWGDWLVAHGLDLLLGPQARAGVASIPVALRGPPQEHLENSYAVGPPRQQLHH